MKKIVYSTMFVSDLVATITLESSMLSEAEIYVVGKKVVSKMGDCLNNKLIDDLFNTLHELDNRTELISDSNQHFINLSDGIKLIVPDDQEEGASKVIEVYKIEKKLTKSCTDCTVSCVSL